MNGNICIDLVPKRAQRVRDALPLAVIWGSQVYWRTSMDELSEPHYRAFHNEEVKLVHWDHLVCDCRLAAGITEVLSVHREQRCGQATVGILCRNIMPVGSSRLSKTAKLRIHMLEFYTSASIWGSGILCSRLSGLSPVLACRIGRGQHSP